MYVLYIIPFVLTQTHCEYFIYRAAQATKEEFNENIKRGGRRMDYDCDVAYCTSTELILIFGRNEINK